MIKYFILIFLFLIVNKITYSNGSQCSYRDSERNITYDLEPFFTSNGTPINDFSLLATTKPLNKDHYWEIYFNLCRDVYLSTCSEVGNTSSCQKNMDLGNILDQYDTGSFHNVSFYEYGFDLIYRSPIRSGVSAGSCELAFDPNRRVTKFVLKCNYNAEPFIISIPMEPSVCYYMVIFESRHLCGCPFKCSLPHGNCSEHRCLCDQYSTGYDCTLLKIEIYSVLSTTIRGGSGYLIGNFTNITPSFNIIISQSNVANVILLNSSTIQFSIDAGSGIQNVSIVAGSLSYVSSYTFQFECLPGCTLPHGQCDNSTSKCICDDQSKGDECQILNIEIESCNSTTIYGGVGFIIGNFSFITFKFDVFIGSLNATDVQLLNSSTIQFSIGPGVGIQDVSIFGENLSYVSINSFEYINKQCLSDCSFPHGQCDLFIGQCICDDQSKGENCQILNIDIGSCDSTNLNGGTSLIRGNFSFIPPKFDILIGKLIATDILVFNTSTIQFSIGAGEGFQNVTITDSISSYTSINLFAYKGKNCPFNCSQHGKCDLINGKCSCDTQTNGTGCEYSRIFLNSIDPTDGNGGTTYLYGYFGTTTPDLSINIGDAPCTNILQINETSIKCDAGVGSGFKTVFFQDRDLKASVVNLFQYFEPIIPNSPKKCIDDCGGPIKGVCTSNGCSCISPWMGNDCKAKLVIVERPSLNYSDPTTDMEIVENNNNTDNQIDNKLFHSLVSISKIREYDYQSNEVYSYTFSSWEFIKINQTANQYNTSFIKSGIETFITVKLEWFDNETGIEFANQNITMNPSSIKYTIEISKYQFSSKLNRLQLIMMASLSSNKTDDVCSDKEFGETTNGDNSNYLKIQVDTHSLYGRFIKRAIIDSMPRAIDNIPLDSSMKPVDSASSSQSYIGISVPYYQNQIIIDPDFSLLLGFSSKSESSICSDNNFSKLSALHISSIAICGFVGLLTIVAVVIYAYYKKRYDRNVMKEIHSKISRNVELYM
ncbi:hypothetical protein RB653_009604 [Dictyostelium firmibasis]|uniref:MRH domain-containing protein n=1 Tax=Dictyostelium firmibasis TaxID=79012 RepID=A0AAN7U6E6_9MYCE